MSDTDSSVIPIALRYLRMADNKKGRGEKTDDEERHQPEREREEVRNRADEDQPMRGDLGERLGDLDEALESQNYPTTTNKLVEAYGNYEIETQDGEESLEEVLTSTDNQTYNSAEDVRSRILGLIHR